MMTAALIPLAASTVFALSSGTPPDANRDPHSQASRPPPSGSAPPPASHQAPDRGASSHAASPGAPPPRGSRAPPPPHGYAPQAAQHVYVQRGYAPPPRPVYRYGYGYPPPPPRQVVVYGSAPPPVAVARSAPPQRHEASGPPQLNRAQTFSLGVRGGSYLSGYDTGESYSDFGLGLSARFRPTEAVGAELSYGYFSQSFSSDSTRTTQPISASLELFAFPGSTVNPYALAGLTWTSRSANDTLAEGATQETYANKALDFGPDLGLGLEIATGKKSSLNLEGRYNLFVTHQADDPAAPGALQASLGMNFYF